MTKNFFKIAARTFRRLLLPLVFLPLACSAATKRPNIIFILTDDLGWGDLGTFFQNARKSAAKPGEPWTATPNLDAFAAGGARLPDHYCAAPVCAPSRASFLLGVSQGHANVRDNQFDKALEDNHTVATVLRQAGYATAAVGKWGLQGENRGKSGQPDWPAYPTKRGFDEFFGYVRHKDGHEHYPKEGLYDGPKQVWNGTREISKDLDACYTADLWTAWAKQWIVKEQKDAPAKPFFLFLAYDTPHAVDELPAQAYPAGGGLKGGLQWLGKPHQMINTASGKPDSWVHPDYANATWDDDENPATPEVAWPDVYRRYATAVRRIDSAVGDLVTLLQDLKIDRDTLVVFSSDNGPSIESYLPGRPLRADFFNSFGPFDGIKRDCLEGGLRVPTVARWPGHIPAGSVDARPSAGYDWLRTFADAAGVPAPARADGISLLPELTGQASGDDSRAIYVEYSEQGKTPNYKEFAPAHRNLRRGQMQAVRLGDLVGLRYHIQTASDPFQIYNVQNDPRETRDLAKEMPAMEERMNSIALRSRMPEKSAPRPYDEEAMPALETMPDSDDVLWKSYKGDFPWVPDFALLKPAAEGTGTSVTLQAMPKDSGGGMMFSGFFHIPADGAYHFSVATDTGAVLKIHDATVIDADMGYRAGAEASGTVVLKAGPHPFRLYYAHRGSVAPQLDFSWSGPGFAKGSISAKAFRRSGE